MHRLQAFPAPTKQKSCTSLLAKCHNSKGSNHRECRDILGTWFSPFNQEDTYRVRLVRNVPYICTLEQTHGSFQSKQACVRAETTHWNVTSARTEIQHDSNIRRVPEDNRDIG